MKKIYLNILLLFAFSVSFAYQIDLAWENPEISSQNQTSFLEKNDETLLVTPFMDDNLKNKIGFRCAIENWSTFKSSITEFLLSKYKQNSFFSYHLVSKKDDSKKPDLRYGLSSTISNPYIPSYSGFDFKWLVGYDFFSNSDNNYSFIHYGFRFDGYIQRRIFFYSNFWAGHFEGDQDYFQNSKLIDSWTQASDDSTKVFLDNVSGKLLYKIHPYWSVAIGRGKYEIGNNIGGSIILNDDCNDYGYFSTKFDFDKIYVHFLHASLIADSTFSGSKDFPDKYLAVHKIGWLPNDFLEVFFGEHVVYGDRNIDPSYILPHAFWRPIEHNLSDRDNILIFAGMNWKPYSRNHLIYTNFIFDELSKSKILDDWWGNKYAIQIGNSYKFHKKKDNRITLEFTAIRPWMYTHRFIWTKFSQDDIGLGYPLGSNLINFSGEVNWEILRNISANLHVSFTRQGSTGNDFSINYDCRSSDTAKWLDGDITDYKKARIVVDWKPLAHHRFKFAFELNKTDDDELEKEIIIGYQASY